jgi:dolichol-phosphate mannosyltransferase
LTPRVSVIVPAFNEGREVTTFLDRVFESVKLPAEILMVYDMPEDSSVPFLTSYAERDKRLRPLHNTYGPGPANAIRYGVDHAEADVVVVTMADGSDDPMQIDQLARLVERGVVVACASRYMAAGQQVGGPWLKSRLSRLAGVSLHLFGRVGTHDATNSFKAYSREFIRKVGIESDAGFEMGIEMVAKARRLGLPVAEVPTLWLDRAYGVSNFKVGDWIPRYLRWYFYALGLTNSTDKPRTPAQKRR